MSTPKRPSLEDRVTALEETASGREVRLTEGVERLTEETSGLNALLTRVDDQQRTLADLQRRTKDSEDRTAEVTSSMATFRKNVVARSITIALVLTGLILAVSTGFYAYVENRQANAERICNERNVGASAVQQYVKDQIAALQTDPNEDAVAREKKIEALKTLSRSFPVVNCASAGKPGR